VAPVREGKETNHSLLINVLSGSKEKGGGMCYINKGSGDGYTGLKDGKEPCWR